MGASASPRPSKTGSLGAALAVTVVVLAVETAGGLWTGSLALLADAGHMATDAACLALSLFAAWAAGLPRDRSRTFGYQRVEVLAALANGAALWLVIGALLREAVGRLAQPPEVRAGPMLAIAAGGLAANLIGLSLLSRGGKEDINVRGAYLHVFSDLLGSVGAVLAGLVLVLTGWRAADPLFSLAICVILGVSSWGLLKDSIHILLEGAPSHLDLESIRSALLSIEGVQEVHDLHLWSLTSGTESMTGHLVVKPGEDTQRVLEAGSALLDERFGLHHVTLQIEKR